MKKYLHYVAGIIMAVIFGFSFLFTKNALDVLATFELLFLRFLTATVVMTILILLKVIKVDFKGKNIKSLVIVAVWQPIIYFIMETMGLKYTSTSEAGVMMAFIPVLVAIFAAFVLDEKPSRAQAVFIAVSVTGVVAIVLGGGKPESGGKLFGIILLLGAVFSATMFNIFSRKASQNFTPYEITYTMMWLGAISFGGIYLVQGLVAGDLNLFSKITPGALSSILYLGILSSVVAFLLVNYSLSKLPASQSAVFANLTTVVSVIAGVTIRGENFEVYKIFGAIAIIIGVWGTNYYGIKKISR
jgi:drug/metabolite transporter (DMT)-like permease